MSLPSGLGCRPWAPLPTGAVVSIARSCRVWNILVLLPIPSLGLLPFRLHFLQAHGPSVA